MANDDSKKREGKKGQNKGDLKDTKGDVKDRLK
ncbi:hypothetical protein BH20ACT10_BH20ACT10_12600 [soil metagenome]|jgi:uncharacterized protein YjbJ (UPF0337 family)